jgi:hypothetical protein
MNNLFSNFMAWFVSKYDSDSGGFYYAASSVHGDLFKADLESTAQAVNILEMTGLLLTIPEYMKSNLINFFLSRQTREGYFLDPHNEMHKVDRMVARALSYSVNSLRRLSSEPQFPIPGSENSVLPDHMQTVEKFKSWVYERPWHDAWMACDNISAASVYFKFMPFDKTKLLLDFLISWLEDKQDKQTGMWGDGRPYIRVSGAFKLGLFYRNMNFPMPRADKILPFINTALKEDVAEDFCWIRNPVDLISVLRTQMDISDRFFLEQFYERTIENMSGFSRHKDHSLSMPNNQVLGLGLEEGDMNAGTQAIRIRMLFHNFFNQKQEPILHSDLLQEMKRIY